MKRPKAPRSKTLPYRDCAAAAIFNRDGKVFIGRRLATLGNDASDVGAPWQMPQGGIDEGESPLVAALREVFEETSMTSLRLLAEAPQWHTYDLPSAALGIALKGRYRGQRQRWFAFAFEGDDSEINVHAPGGGAHRPEFDAWRWEALESTPELIVPFKRDVYHAVVADFAHLPGEVRSGR